MNECFTKLHDSAHIKRQCRSGMCPEVDGNKVHVLHWCNYVLFLGIFYLLMYFLFDTFAFNPLQFKYPTFYFIMFCNSAVNYFNDAADLN